MKLVGCLPPSHLPEKAKAEPAAQAPTEPPPSPPDEAAPANGRTPEAPPKASAVEPGIGRTTAPTRGTLPQAVVQEKLDAANPAIKACYERSLKTKPTLEGNISINFVVGLDGTVEHAEAGQVEQPLNDAGTVECVLGEIRKLEFPKPNGGKAFLNYPMHFEPPRSEP